MTSLQQRLHRLRASTGAQPSAAIDLRPQGQPACDPAEAAQVRPDPPAPGARPPGLAERIRRLSIAGPKRVQPRPTPETIAESLGAELIEPGLLQLERRQPLTQRQGRFQPAHGLACHSARAPDLASLALPAPDRWTFIDTETSGLAGGTGTWVFVVGIARVQDRELLMRQYLLLGLDAEAAMMTRVQAELMTANPLISYNGKTFDLPLIETRLRLSGLPRLPETIPHLDLLYPIRRAFATRWPDCRLANCEQRLLGFKRTDDLPGSEAPAAWLDWLREGDSARLGAVLRHNRLDLLSLAALLPALLDVQRQPQAYNADLLALARHLERSGQAQAAERLLDDALTALEPNATLALARLKRRRGAWAEAARLWEQLAAADEGDAIIELAKYQEHVRGAFDQALAYAERLPNTPEHAHRRARLQRRLAKPNRTPRSLSPLS